MTKKYKIGKKLYFIDGDTVKAGAVEAIRTHEDADGITIFYYLNYKELIQETPDGVRLKKWRFSAADVYPTKKAAQEAKR